MSRPGSAVSTLTNFPGIPCVAKVVVDLAKDVVVRLTDDLGIVREPARDACDDRTIPIPDIGFRKGHIAPLYYYQP